MTQNAKFEITDSSLKYSTSVLFLFFSVNVKDKEPGILLKTTIIGPLLQTNP